MNLISIEQERFSLDLNVGHPDAVNQELCLGLHVSKCNIQDIYYNEEEDVEIEKKFNGTRICFGFFLLNLVLVIKNEEIDEFEF